MKESEKKLSRPAPIVAKAIELSLLGPLRLVVAGSDATPSARKARALLAYLALRKGERVPRETLAGLLWGEHGNEQARASLRQTLSGLRKVLGDAAISSSNENVELSASRIETDLDTLISSAGSAELEAMKEASALFRGELLEGLVIGEPAFDQWLTAERERTRLLVSHLLSRLVDGLAKEQRIEEAIAEAARLLALDPLQERVHRTLMRLYLAQGRYDAALHQFELCRRELADQLDVTPEKKTLDLVAEVKARRRRGGDGNERRPERVPDAVLRPDKPSIAVLPFVNLSGDPEQDYFAEGIAEDLITQLSRLRDLFVIARNSTFIYKGRAVPIAQVANDLGVRFVLEGSVRRGGNRIRVTVQLIDTKTGGHVWAERYDRELTDLFELQDEITKAITVALQVKLTEGERARIVAEGTRDLQAWELYLQGRAAMSTFTKHDNFRARQLYEQALARDPSYGLALVDIGISHWLDARMRHTSDPSSSLDQARAIARQMEEISGETSNVNLLKGCIALFDRRHEEAVAFCRRGIELAPSDSYATATLGMIQIYAGDIQGAIESLKASLRLSPYGINWVLYYMAFAHLWLGEAEDARQAATAYLSREPQEPFAYLLSALVEAASGRPQAARDFVSQVRGRYPELTCDDFAFAQFYKEPEWLEQLLSWLKQAGLPE